jgi:phage-related protein
LTGLRREIIWLHGRVTTPPFSFAARQEAGFMLRQVQSGASLRMPWSRPMPAVGPRCHELRIVDSDVTWRVIYRVDETVILVADVFGKRTRATPRSVIENCKHRLWRYDHA